jgi:hypothetical protein
VFFYIGMSKEINTVSGDKKHFSVLFPTEILENTYTVGYNDFDLMDKMKSFATFLTDSKSVSNSAL